MWRQLLLLLLIPPASTAARAADTLVVTPDSFRPALAKWLELRRGQGHAIEVVRPPQTAEGLAQAIADAAASGDLEHVVLVGDAPNQGSCFPDAIPTDYRPAPVSKQYSGEALIATDNPFADLDDDTAPELAVGRIPCRTPSELAAYLDRVISHEQKATATTRLNLVASPGRFSPLIDSMIELTAHQAFRQLTPKHVVLNAIYNSSTSAHFPDRPFRQAVLDGLGEPALAWIYLGHATHNGLDRVEPVAAAPQMLTCGDLRRDAPPGVGPVLAALLACETGRIDGPDECLAESMLLCPSGPLAVVASSRVCMPYGNSVLGMELLSRLFDQPVSIGLCVRDGKRRALAPDSELPLRASVKQLGLGASPNADRLDAEVEEHVLMYNLLGDPLLRVH
ncbi:hypothetical protein KOR34_26670 [Posidoniimonas corsicana]|uniref:Gingipain domain-containing protein n=1 Tax=Posidoniimonas corsicana TaxID=1938618 RepID=A0A5C5VIT8_9BACT|nr:C25 family cysteine peptidase [Posidoniimonas corsicana]TWT37705.1 hypothetical protein KOR34_26670 [Posidoniimonas corsicana]